MVSGPKQTRLLKNLKSGFSTQKSFKEQTVSLINVLNEIGNPFLNDSNELLTLDNTWNVLDDKSMINAVQTIGKEQYAKYHKDVIIDHARSIHDPIKKNSLPF